MATGRLTLALEGGHIRLPQEGRIAVFAPRADTDLSALPAPRVHIICGFKPDHDHFARLGYATLVSAEGRYGAAVIVLPRAKARARALVAEAAEVSCGPIIIDGQKTDGVESLLKDLRARGEIGTPLSKAHGKVFQLDAPPPVKDWAARDTAVADRFVTRPGVFSADGIDPGSALLAAHLPERMSGMVADLGGGWGYLSAEILTREGPEALHLVEADHDGIDCARRNVIDPRLHLHWADVERWEPPVLFDWVVMNPPFHTGRSADPGLGRAFVEAAARMLRPAGQLWMVANRHLPYETLLSHLFSQSEEIAGDSRYKILRAAKPLRQRR